MTGPEPSSRADDRLRRVQSAFTDLDFEAADRLDELVGISALDAERRRELMTVVGSLAEADHVIGEVRRAMRGPYGGLLRLTILKRRSARSLARVTDLNDKLNAKLDQVSRLPGGDRQAEVLRDRLSLHLEVDAELIASLSPERRAVVDSLRAQRAASA